MNRSTRLPADLGAIIAAAIAADLAGEDVKIPGLISIELDGEGSLDEQLQRATEQAAARHREVCETCRELHEEHAPKADGREVPDLATFSRDELARKHKAQIMALEKKHAVERVELERGFEPKSKASPGNRVIGHMAFFDGRVVPTSFEEDIEILARKVKLGLSIGLDANKLTTKPVFAQF